MNETARQMVWNWLSFWKTSWRRPSEGRPPSMQYGRVEDGMHCVCSMRLAARALLAFKLNGIIRLHRKGAITHRKCQEGLDQEAWPVDHTCYLDTSWRLINPSSVSWASVSWSWNTLKTRLSPCYITIQVSTLTVKTVFKQFKPQISTQYDNTLWWLKIVFIGTAYFWRPWRMVVNRYLYFQGSKNKKVGNHGCKPLKGC